MMTRVPVSRIYGGGNGEACPNRIVVALLRGGVDARRVWLLLVVLERIWLGRDAPVNSCLGRHSCDVDDAGT